MFIYYVHVLEQKLEETRDELQRVTESESLLRSRCVCLEEKQRQKKDQMEVTPNNIMQKKKNHLFSKYHILSVYYFLTICTIFGVRQ